MKNQIQFLDPKLATEEKWYSIEELAKWSGISVETLKKGDSPLTKLSIDFKVDTRVGGYHNTKKFYSENVLKALKEYQISHGVSNATKNKDIVIQGNNSYIQQSTYETTINGLLDNPEALLTLVAESTKRIALLQKENKIMQPKADYYDNFIESSNYTEIGHLGKLTGIGEKKIFKLLIGDNIIRKKYVDNISYYESNFNYDKYFVRIPVPFKKPDSTKVTRDKLMLTQEGVAYFVKRYKEMN